MEKSDVITALAALAQDNRLDTYRLLVRAGPDGLPAGEVAAALGLPPNTLSFHFDRLRQAGLVTVRRAGRSMIYAARFDTMRSLLGYLTERVKGILAVETSITAFDMISAEGRQKLAKIPIYIVIGDHAQDRVDASRKFLP